MEPKRKSLFVIGGKHANDMTATVLDEIAETAGGAEGAVSWEA